MRIFATDKAEIQKILYYGQLCSNTLEKLKEMDMFLHKHTHRDSSEGETGDQSSEVMSKVM